ncbi:hypothetical protein EV361DRAFT_873909, partial [Lentinula raphanica]
VLLLHQLPKILWDVTSTPPDTSNFDELFGEHERPSIFKFVSERHQTLYAIEESGFMVKGQNTQELVQSYTDLVRKAIADEDFTSLLSENRHFQLVHIESTGVETYVTSGPGPEKKVMGLFFKSQFDNAAGLLTNVIDDYTMLATVPMSSALDISPTKKDDLTLFGSAVGLSLVHGNYPAKLNPLLLAYLLNDCSLSSISKSSVLEFFPTLHQTLTRWLALDYHDNSTLSSFAPHFAIYHNLPVSALYDRSESLHRSLAWTMLHNAIIGPETADHPYFRAFLKGLLLPCGTLALNLSDIAKRFDGGTTEFITSLLDTRINGNYTMLRVDYGNNINDTMRRTLQEALDSIFPDLADKGFPAIFREFLEGSGLPAPLTVQDLQGRFAKAVPLEDVSKKVPHILRDGPYTEVCLVDDNDPRYFPIDSDREDERMRHLINGTCCFKTCTRMMLIPASYILRTLQTPLSGRQVAMDTISRWLFMEILDAIGNYNIV